MKTKYLNELEALQNENAKLSTWLQEAQNAVCKLTTERNAVVCMLEKQSGSEYISGTRFKRFDGSEFAVNNSGEIITIPPRPPHLDHWLTEW